MYSKYEALFYLRHKHLAVVSFADVESFAGIKHTVLVNWVYRGLLPLNVEKNGKGGVTLFTIGDCCKLHVAGKLYDYGLRVPVIGKLCLSVAQHVNEYSRELAGFVRDAFNVQHALPDSKFVSFWYDRERKCYRGIRAADRLPVMDGAVQLAFNLEELGETMIKFMGNYDLKTNPTEGK